MRIKTKESKRRAKPRKFQVDNSPILNIRTETDEQEERDEIGQTIPTSGVTRMRDTTMDTRNENEEEKQN